jgi:hypothetical protein
MTLTDSLLLTKITTIKIISLIIILVLVLLCVSLSSSSVLTAHAQQQQGGAVTTGPVTGGASTSTGITGGITCSVPGACTINNSPQASGGAATSGPVTGGAATGSQTTGGPYRPSSNTLSSSAEISSGNITGPDKSLQQAQAAWQQFNMIQSAISNINNTKHDTAKAVYNNISP